MTDITLAEDRDDTDDATAEVTFEDDDYPYRVTYRIPKKLVVGEIVRALEEEGINPRPMGGVNVTIGVEDVNLSHFDFDYW